MRLPLKVAAAVFAFLGAAVAIAIDPLETELVLACIAAGVGLGFLADAIP